MTKSRFTNLIKTAREHDFVGWYETGNIHLNLCGDYDYLENGYYLSQEFEKRGDNIYPNCKEMLDAYIPPIFLEKAQRAGVPVPRHFISNGYFEPPVIIDPINPFMFKSRTILKPGREQAIAKSMTRNYTYAVCCQQLNPGDTVVKFRSVLGWCTNSDFRKFSGLIMEVFHIPLATVRLVMQKNGEALFSDISPLDFESLRATEFEYLEGKISWAK